MLQYKSILQYDDVVRYIWRKILRGKDSCPMDKLRPAHLMSHYFALYAVYRRLIPFWSSIHEVTLSSILLYEDPLSNLSAQAVSISLSDSGFEFDLLALMYLTDMLSHKWWFSFVLYVLSHPCVQVPCCLSNVDWLLILPAFLTYYHVVDIVCVARSSLSSFPFATLTVLFVASCSRMQWG